MEDNRLVYEDWAYIRGYEGIYIISSRGRIISPSKLTFLCQRYKNPRKLHFTKQVQLKTQVTNSGYELVHLYRNKVRKADTIHRLVAIAFVPNPLNLPQVNHLDKNKLHNVFYNFQWSTQSENISHAFADGGNRNAREKARERMRILGKKYAHSNLKRLLENNKKMRKPILQLSISGEILKEFPSVKSAKKVAPNVNHVLSGKYSQSAGFKWAYK